ncbi:sulfotransferase domain-containing protein [Lederbergia citrea]|uniref:Sulfotransferase domain-containing protein n=1 Tax=Lederbergia citrea TaxID=2833581 RepID=A0A942UIH8_9BACI|nr:sulfotransferase domain-containing protein [Lederbergia citrea]MBS4222085.1 sulfotransferase domain-containing protein [Lederbergia citrea]
MGKKKEQFLASHERMPDFLIIGAMKCGTTTLYKNLVKHSSIVSAKRKELHFFDKEDEYSKGIDSYKNNFPLLNKKKLINKPNLVTGEATPRYLFIPEVPERVFNAMPNVKLIVLLRNPVDRAYSHYHHFKRRELEKLTFEEAIDKELNGIIEPNINRTYLARGNYVDQLKRWMDFFPREQFLILESENYYRNPRIGINQVCQFLDLPEWNFEYTKEASHPYPKMEEHMRERLIKYFKPYNEKLEDYLGDNFSWER